MESSEKTLGESGRLGKSYPRKLHYDTPTPPNEDYKTSSKYRPSPPRQTYEPTYTPYSYNAAPRISRVPTQWHRFYRLFRDKYITHQHRYQIKDQLISTREIINRIEAYKKQQEHLAQQENLVEEIKKKRRAVKEKIDEQDAI